MSLFVVDKDRCIQCGECVADCPPRVLAMEDDIPVCTNEAGCYRCQHCLAICPTAAVSVLGVDPDKSVELKGNLPSYEQFVTLVKGRRAVRRYREEDVPREVIQELLDAAWHAPTGVNTQAVQFTVVFEGATLRALRGEMLERLDALGQTGGIPDGIVGRYMNLVLDVWRSRQVDVMFRGAPHLLLTSAPKDAPCPVQDAHIALATFDLLATARGLGTVWDGIFMMAASLLPDVPVRLGVPTDHLIGYAMAFGTPAMRYHRTVQRGPARVTAAKWGA